MKIIQYLEKRVEKKAQRMLRNKRFYAWVALISILVNSMRLIAAFRKYVLDDWASAWRFYMSEKRLKDRENYSNKTGTNNGPEDILPEE